MALKGANHPKKGRMIAAHERRKRILELRIAGHTLREIGEQVGLTESAVSMSLTKALEMTQKAIHENAEGLRTLEAERLDQLAKGIHVAAMAGDLAAIDRYLKIQERRARLMGLDLKADDAGGPQIVVIDTRLPTSAEVVDSTAVEVTYPELEAGETPPFAGDS